MNKIKAIITGATGMVGEGVLHECLHNDAIESILVINRKPCGTSHPKLKEIIHSDFYNFSAIEPQLTNYNACFFCLGTTSLGMKEPEYYSITHDITLHMATTLCKLNPDMTFCYVSGAGTSDKAKSMWTRVKSKTENDLKKLPFKKVYNFRPAAIQPTKGLKNTLGAYKYLGWLFPVLRVLSPNSVSTLKELGLAMINSAAVGYEKDTIEVKDIKILAKR